MKQLSQRPLLLVVMDGVGVRAERFGNVWACAHTPNLDALRNNHFWTTLKAHGPFVGMPSDKDLGNSEVGHNALGAGRVFDQGAKLVKHAIENGSIFRSETWKKMVAHVGKKNTLHFIGLLSDGNVHSHEDHLYALLRAASKEGVEHLRVHILLDGRDVGEKSAEVYIERLEKVLGELCSSGKDACIASGGGRMHITMDRYQADWSMVERGWLAHVEGEAIPFPDTASAIKQYRMEPKLTDQNLPAFVIHKDGKPVGKIQDGDGVVFFNFRGDRAIEISKAFEDALMPHFTRKRHPKVFYAGMMQYDGDEKIPQHFLVTPPLIENTLGEYLVEQNVKQFACSETQKYGHVTYFWNGNRSGYLDPQREEYLEIPSDRISFELKPWMKAHEITEATIARMEKKNFQFGRINYANGDMVGHTGDFDASLVALEIVDLMVGRLLEAAQKFGYQLIITADHGNCDDMFEDGATEAAFPKWEKNRASRPAPKTSHSLAEVPFAIYDPALKSAEVYRLATLTKPYGLANVASTVLQLLGLEPRKQFEPSILTKG